MPNTPDPNGLEYNHGYRFGRENAAIYGANHAARYDYQNDTPFCRGYRKGYQDQLEGYVATATS